MDLDGQEKIPAKELQLMREWLECVSTEKQRLVEWCEEAQKEFTIFKRAKRQAALRLLCWCKL